MRYIKATDRAQLVDWLLELVPVWEVPVTCAMLHKAHPEFTVPVYAGVLKTLTAQQVLVATPGLKDQTFYSPAGLVKQPDIQRIICKGLKHWNDEGAKNE